MPELPDVEGFRRELARRLPGKRAHGVDIRDAGVLRNCSARQLERAVRGHRFSTPQRHGKWLLLPTDGPTLLVHSGMTGRPYYTRVDAATARDDRLIIRLDRGELRYADQRKLRGIWLARDAAAVKQTICPLGPDALTLDRDTFFELLRDTRRRLKPTLLDQRVIAGLGNLLIDEICWQARVNPHRSLTDLEGGELRRLYTTMRRVLRTSVRHGRVPALRNWLTRARDQPQPCCPRCGTRLRRVTAGRTTFYCPRCQPAR